MDLALSINTVCQRAAQLQLQAVKSPPQPHLVAEALHELYGVLDELRASQEEVLWQNRQLLSTQRELEIERQRYHDLFNFAPYGYLVTDAEGLILEANFAIATLLKFPQADLIGKPLILFIEAASSSAFLALLAGVATSGDTDPAFVKDWEGRVCPYLGPPIDVAVTLSVNCRANGTVASLRWLLRDITQQKREIAKIHHQAFYDPLTHLPNRTFFDAHLSQAIAQAERNSEQLAIVFLDLDGFKDINDTLGHATGDRLLAKTADRLTQDLREADVLVRWGGDEFALVMHQVEGVATVTQVCERLQAQLRPIFEVNGHSVTISSSMGAALFPRHGRDPETLLRHADQALYAAKDSGRNTYRLAQAGKADTASEFRIPR
ncbi:MAG: diguanylate cyclase [Leptolyngbya sp. DLM2.Bin27]|nr:MAG: diguanylate cyclase [Leptolyngbya sp. DLM2.Bin27]